MGQGSDHSFFSFLSLDGGRGGFPEIAFQAIQLGARTGGKERHIQETMLIGGWQEWNVD